MFIRALSMTAVLLALAACATGQNPQTPTSAVAKPMFADQTSTQAMNQIAQSGMTGTIIGATGAPVGAAFSRGVTPSGTLAVGAIAGTWPATDLANSLTDTDKDRLRSVVQYAMVMQKPGATSQWTDPEHTFETTVYTGGFGNVLFGSFCRAYDQSVTKGGNTEHLHARACRDATGAYKISE